MSRGFRSVGVVILLAALGALGCGDDRIERGLALPDEVATPESEHELGMTEPERQAQRDAEEDAAEAERFDEAMAGAKAE